MDPKKYVGPALNILETTSPKVEVASVRFKEFGVCPKEEEEDEEEDTNKETEGQDG